MLQHHLHILAISQHIGGGVALVRQNEPHPTSVFKAQGNRTELVAIVVIHLRQLLVHKGSCFITIGSMERILRVFAFRKLVLPLRLEVDSGIQSQNGIRREINIRSGLLKEASGVIIDPGTDGVVDFLAAQIAPVFAARLVAASDIGRILPIEQ